MNLIPFSQFLPSTHGNKRVDIFVNHADETTDGILLRNNLTGTKINYELLITTRQISNCCPKHSYSIAETKKRAIALCRN